MMSIMDRQGRIEDRHSYDAEVRDVIRGCRRRTQERRQGLLRINEIYQM